LSRVAVAVSLATFLTLGAPVAQADNLSVADPQHQQIAQAQDAGGDIWDPIEGVNRYFFEVNRFLDEIALKPAAAWYGMLPQGARTGVGNALGNLRTPWTVVNDGLQGEGTRAGTAIARFFINTFIGFFGVFDPAKDMGLVHHDEDAGQTLAVWGVDDGPYVMLPLLGSSNGRDIIGIVVDAFLDPFNIVSRGADANWAPMVRAGTTAVHQRDANAQQIEDVQRSSTDLYATVRRVTVERRRSEIRNTSAGSSLPSPRMTDGEVPASSGPRAEVPR
jgi:phospholipid-binding lipoprotein MlaA